jgi:uncharacterized protein involved in exopolysaccharide biosynthesis
MLQKLHFDDDAEPDNQVMRPPRDEEGADLGYLFRPVFYWELVKRRWPFFVVPFIPISLGAIGLAAILPPTYLSEGKILVQSQQIPTELVRPTVTSAAQERIQVIEQRTMTRENLLAMIDKFQLFPEKRQLMEPSQLVELMRKNTKIEPVAQSLSFKQSSNPTIVFSVGFEYPEPQAAARVANELMTRILNEDLRDRTSRATDTTKFLAKEVQRLQAENAAVEAKIVQAKISQNKSGAAGSDELTQLAQLKADYAQKSALYADRHPLMVALKRQISALEKTLGQPSQVTDVEPLQAQQDNLQKDLEVASAKLAAARLGESLERDQQSEKLEVIEQPSVPSEPTRPNRPKIVGIGLALAIAAGVGLSFLREVTDSGIRRASDIYNLVDSRYVVAIPYITTHAELHRHKRLMTFGIGFSVLVLVAAVVLGYLLLPPIDLMIAKARVGLFR